MQDLADETEMNMIIDQTSLLDVKENTDLVKCYILKQTAGDQKDRLNWFGYIQHKEADDSVKHCILTCGKRDIQMVF